MNKNVILIVGLGYVGVQYRDTRHNVGFSFLDRICEIAGIKSWNNDNYLKCEKILINAKDFLKLLSSYPTFLMQSKLLGQIHNSDNILHTFHSTMSNISDECQILFVKPTTFMNRSGESLHIIKKMFNIIKTIIIYDDLDTRFGNVLFKNSGGSGGHNGIKSINNFFKDEYMRIRIGIGANILLHSAMQDIFQKVLMDRLNFDSSFKNQTFFKIMNKTMQGEEFDFSQFHSYNKCGGLETSHYVLSKFSQKELSLLNPILEYGGISMALHIFEFLYADKMSNLDIFNIQLK